HTNVGSLKNRKATRPCAMIVVKSAAGRFDGQCQSLVLRGRKTNRHTAPLVVESIAFCVPFALDANAAQGPRVAAIVGSKSRLSRAAGQGSVTCERLRVASGMPR